MFRSSKRVGGGGGGGGGGEGGGEEGSKMRYMKYLLLVKPFPGYANAGSSSNVALNLFFGKKLSFICHS